MPKMKTRRSAAKRLVNSNARKHFAATFWNINLLPVREICVKRVSFTKPIMNA